MYQFEPGSTCQFQNPFGETVEVVVTVVRLFADSDGAMHTYITYTQGDHGGVRSGSEMARILSKAGATQINYPDMQINFSDL